MKSHTKIITAVSLLCALCVWGVVVWEINNIEANVGVVNTLRDQIVSGLTQAASATSIRKAFIGLGEDPHIFDQYFISATGTPVFIGNIEDLAQSEHLTVSIGSVTQSGSAETSELNLTLSVVGSWTDALHFIHLLELLPYGATVSQVNLVSSNENGLSVAGATSVKNWRADIQLNVESD